MPSPRHGAGEALGLDSLASATAVLVAYLRFHFVTVLSIAQFDVFAIDALEHVENVSHEGCFSDFQCACNMRCKRVRALST